MHAAQSPWGSPWQTDPTKVPRVRTIGSATNGAAAAMVGWRSAMTADFSMSS